MMPASADVRALFEDAGLRPVIEIVGSPVWGDRVSGYRAIPGTAGDAREVMASRRPGQASWSLTVYWRRYQPKLARTGYTRAMLHTADHFTDVDTMALWLGHRLSVPVSEQEVAAIIAHASHPNPSGVA